MGSTIGAGREAATRPPVDDMSAPATSPAITVLGSANVDIIVPVDRHPRLGETVLGGDHYRAAGGKGANQAVACSRLGGPTRFVGCVGDDEPGRYLRAALADADVDVTDLTTLPDTPSGLALIVVDDRGENTIVVSSGANGRLRTDHLDAAGLVDGTALLLQLEIPIATVAWAVAAARGLVVLNPAPAAMLPRDVLERVDVLVPNRGELALLAGRETEPQSVDDVVELARSVRGPARVVTTLGADGAVAVDGDEVTVVAASPVQAVDTTGAGDAFCGALTVALVEGATLGAATRWASIAAGLAVTTRGAQPAMPTRTQVETAASQANN